MRAYNQDIMDLPLDVAADCDMTFTDPPWGQGPLKAFEKTAAKAGRPAPQNSIERILRRLFRLAPKGPLFIEYTILQSGKDLVISLGEMEGHRLHRQIQAEQFNGKPYVVLQFNSDMPPPENPRKWGVMDAVCKYHKPQLVFEPFAGSGRHSIQLARRGASVVANEINPKQYIRLKERLGL